MTPRLTCPRGVSLVSGELEEARGLALVLRETAAALLVEVPEIALSGGVALVGGELVEARGLAIVCWQTAAALFVIDPELELSTGVALLGGRAYAAIPSWNGIAASIAAFGCGNAETVMKSVFELTAKER